jgi:hypothetical protein
MIAARMQVVTFVQNILGPLIVPIYRVPKSKKFEEMLICVSSVHPIS